jgi:hypothetical protein
MSKIRSYFPCLFLYLINHNFTLFFIYTVNTVCITNAKSITDYHFAMFKEFSFMLKNNLKILFSEVFFYPRFLQSEPNKTPF